MPTCEHGHDHNVFITEGDVHDCKTCGVCQFLEAEAKGEEERGVAAPNRRAGVRSCTNCRNSPVTSTPANSAPTNDDLLDRLTELVLEHAEVENLPYLNRGGDLPDVRLKVPERKQAKLREEMSEAMKQWVHEIFPKPKTQEEIEDEVHQEQAMAEAMEEEKQNDKNKADAERAAHGEGINDDAPD